MNGSQGNFIYKTSLFLNDTEIEVVTISELTDEFEIEGTYSISEFDFSNGNIDVENDDTCLLYTSPSPRDS